MLTEIAQGERLLIGPPTKRNPDMFFIIGSVTVLASVAGGYLANGGHMSVLWQPFELLIIIGAAVGGFITANRKPVLSASGKAVAALLKGEKYDKKAYLDLLSLLYHVFKLAKTKGALALEQHVEKPDESSLFAQYPKFQQDHHALVFLCDYLRLLTLGTDNHHEMETLMDEEIETHHDEQHAVYGAIQSVADGLPALGIVAAVLGVIHAMGALDQSPEVLGGLIGAALVGTFAGIFLSYGVVAPVATKIKTVRDKQLHLYVLIKQSLIAYMNGAMPQVAVEFGRKTIPNKERPSIDTVENETSLGGGAAKEAA
jgi:chemotaxis protein MotA